MIFFRLFPSNRLSWKIYRDDHSSLSGKCGVYAIAFMRMIYLWHATMLFVSKDRYKCSCCGLNLVLVQNF